MEDELSELAIGLLFFVGGCIFAIGGWLTSRLLAPHRPNPEKLTTYECGEEPIGNAWGQINFRFYAVGLVFLIFDVEILLLFPWITVFSDRGIIRQVPEWPLFTLIEIIIFILILVIGYIYAYSQKVLNWNISSDQSSKLTEYKSVTGIPNSIYTDLNDRLKKL